MNLPFSVASRAYPPGALAYLPPGLLVRSSNLPEADVACYSTRHQTNNLKYDATPTSNDLLHRLVAKQSLQELNYQIVSQCADDIRNIENAPAVSMVPYLLTTGQIRLLTTISVYSVRGESREQVRLLYMNAPAIQVWKEMGKAPKIIGAQFRPPHTALLTLGVPFSE